MSSSVSAPFGNGAAVGAFLTERIPAVTLAIPAAALLMVLLLSETSPAADASRSK